VDQHHHPEFEGLEARGGGRAGGELGSTAGAWAEAGDAS